MTRMANHDSDAYDDERPRSIFSALWFRALLVVLVLGVIAAIALPYVLDFVNPPSSRQAGKATTPRQAAAPPTSGPSALAAPMGPSSTPTGAGSPPSLPPMGGAVASTAPAPSASAPSASPTVTRPAATAPNVAAPATAGTATGTTVARRVATPPAKSMATTTVRGSYWVQVGAFKSEETAKRVAAKLRDLSYEVHESTTQSAAKTDTVSAAPGGQSPADRYDVFVSGAAASDLTAKLTAKGLAADAVAGGLVVKPSLPLRDAVALSRDLTADGLKVQVKRASVAPGASGADAAGGSAATLYRVRVGKFSDRAAAQAAAKELEAKGYKGFIARGPR